MVVEAVRKIARAIGAFFMPPPSILPDQRVKSEFGYRTRAARRSQGWVILTADRLIFERAIPMSFGLDGFFPSPNFDIALRDIVRVELLPRTIWEREPVLPVLGLSLISGQQVFIQLGNYHVWFAELEKARQRVGAPSSYDDSD